MKLPRHVNNIKWIPPKPFFFKVNTDGAVKSNPSLANGGGLIRDHHRRWVKGFHCRMANLHNMEAELCLNLPRSQVFLHFVIFS